MKGIWVGQGSSNVQVHGSFCEARESSGYCVDPQVPCALLLSWGEKILSPSFCSGAPLLSIYFAFA